MKNVMKYLLFYFLMILLVACKEDEGERKLTELNITKEVTKKSPIGVYGVVDTKVIYQVDDTKKKSNFKKYTGKNVRSVYCYNWETGEEYKIGDLTNRAKRSDTLVVNDKLYFWVSVAPEDKEKVSIQQLIEIDSDREGISVLYENSESEWSFVEGQRGMQDLEDDLVFVLKRNNGFEIVSLNTDTKELKVELTYRYDFIQEKGELIRAIDTDENQLNVLVQSEQGNSVQYRIDVFNKEMQFQESIDITEMQSKYGWREATIQFEYSEGFLLYANEAGEQFVVKVSEDGVQPIVEYSYGYWENGQYYENDIYYKAMESSECHLYKLFRQAGKNKIYRLNMISGQISCAEIMGNLEGYHMSYIRRLNEEQMIIEMRKATEGSDPSEAVWYLMEMDDFTFEEVLVN